VRVREFQMAEIEHFVDPQDKRHPKFKSVAHLKLPLYSAAHQEAMKDFEWINLGEAVEKRIVDNETLGYFLARIFLFLKEVGVDVEHHVRFRQHMRNEMAHYAQDCWDAEAELSSGWLEIVGCADRSAYDLTQHTLGSGTKLLAARKFKEPRPEKQTTIAIQRQVIGKEFKKNSQAINAFLEKLNEEEKSKLKAQFEQEGKIDVAV
jgi:glycyl-tRNA synthetase